MGTIGISSFFVGILSIFISSLKIQLILFSIFMLVIFFTIRPLFLKFLNQKNAEKIGLNNYIGNSYPVVEVLEGGRSGRIKIGEQTWRVKTDSNSFFSVEDEVKVLKVEGSTFIVSKKNH